MCEGEGRRRDAAQEVHETMLVNCGATTYPSHDHASHPRETHTKKKVLSASSNSKPHAALSHVV